MSKKAVRITCIVVAGVMLVTVGISVAMTIIGGL